MWLSLPETLLSMWAELWTRSDRSPVCEKRLHKLPVDKLGPGTVKGLWTNEDYDVNL